MLRHACGGLAMTDVIWEAHASTSPDFIRDGDTVAHSPFDRLRVSGFVVGLMVRQVLILGRMAQ